MSNTERPILFNTEMVRAILDGRKTQTRRIAKYSTQRVYDFACVDGKWYETYDPNNPPQHLVEWYLRMGTVCPYMIGDVLWVRETFDDIELGHPWYYKADGDLRPECWKGERWNPSIHMPRDAARLFLKVNAVRVEHLHDMSEEDAIAEGFADSPVGTDSPLERFSELWNKTIKRDDLRQYGWHANPLVWVIEFERLENYNG